MLTCLLNNQKINCFEDRYSKEELKNWSKKMLLLCPVCGKPYEYCHGKIKTPYFRHMYKAVCESKYSEPETEEHLMGKRELYAWLKKQDGVTECTLEGWIPSTKQRPDMMFYYYGKLCVLEYQCSPISSEYYERHELYQAAGIKDIWICGVQKYLQYYHTEGGIKKLNILEKESGIYYDTLNKCIYYIDKTLTEKQFNKIRNSKTKYHLMVNPYDYRPGLKNYFKVKNLLISYNTEYYYPSGRPSNKYPFPVAKQHFNKNISLAKCMALESLKIKSID